MARNYRPGWQNIKVVRGQHFIFGPSKTFARKPMVVAGCRGWNTTPLYRVIIWPSPKIPAGWSIWLWLVYCTSQSILRHTCNLDSLDKLWCPIFSQLQLNSIFLATPKSRLVFRFTCLLGTCSPCFMDGNGEAAGNFQLKADGLFNRFPGTVVQVEHSKNFMWSRAKCLFHHCLAVV